MWGLAEDQIVGTAGQVTALAMRCLDSSKTPDSYPFLLSGAVVQKLRFVHDTIERPVPSEKLLSWCSGAPRRPGKALAKVTTPSLQTKTVCPLTREKTV
jgi:hypothetical protein